MAGVPLTQRPQYILSEEDLRVFAGTAFAEAPTGGPEDAALDALIQGQAEWLEERRLGKGMELPPDAEELVSADVRKVAVDTLYAAREDNRVMDQAAVLVAANVLRAAAATPAAADEDEAPPPPMEGEVLLVARDDDAEQRPITAVYDPSCKLVQFIQYGEEVFGTLEPVTEYEWAEMAMRLSVMFGGGEPITAAEAETLFACYSGGRPDNELLNSVTPKLEIIARKELVP